MKESFIAGLLLAVVLLLNAFGGDWLWVFMAVALFAAWWWRAHASSRSDPADVAQPGTSSHPRAACPATAVTVEGANIFIRATVRHFAVQIDLLWTGLEVAVAALPVSIPVGVALGILAAVAIVTFGGRT